MEDVVGQVDVAADPANVRPQAGGCSAIENLEGGFVERWGLRIVLDCGVPLVRFPCMGVVSHLHTTLPEMAAHVQGKGPIGDYLFQIYRDYRSDQFAYSKQIWDLAPIGWLVNPQWTQMELVSSPRLTDRLTWAFDDSRHAIASARYLDRDSIFRDLFTKLEQAASSGAILSSGQPATPHLQ